VFAGVPLPVDRLKTGVAQSVLQPGGDLAGDLNHPSGFVFLCGLSEPWPNGNQH
jgi:hypothetical protein